MPTRASAEPTRRLWAASQSMNSAVSRLRHIHAGKRANASRHSCAEALPWTCRSSTATSGQSPSMATMVNPCFITSSRVMRFRMR